MTSKRIFQKEKEKVTEKQAKSIFKLVKENLPKEIVEDLIIKGKEQNLIEYNLDEQLEYMRKFATEYISKNTFGMDCVGLHDYKKLHDFTKKVIAKLKESENK
jgi:hypothetical protein